MDGRGVAVYRRAYRARGRAVAWLVRSEVTIDEADVPLAEPVDGGADLHRILGLLRRRDRREGGSGDGARATGR